MGTKLLTLVSRDAAPLSTVELMGPFLLGLIVNYFLWGIQITQSYYYYKSYRKNDSMWNKLTVTLLFTMDLVQTICATKTGWSFLVDKWGDLDSISQTPDWGSFLMPLTDSITASVVHLFYAQKMFMLLKAPYNYICTGVVVAISCLQLTAGVGCSIFQFTIHLTLAHFNRINTWVGIWLTAASVTDIIITAVMTWKLKSSRTGFQQTDDVISKLIRLTVETGLATAVVQIVDVVIFLIWPTKPFHNVPTVMAPKVYSNSVLAVLNSRNPRKGTGQWDSQPSNLFTSATGETVQTISISNNFELHDRLRSPRNPPTPRSVKASIPDVENALSFKDKEGGYLTS